MAAHVRVELNNSGARTSKTSETRRHSSHNNIAIQTMADSNAWRNDDFVARTDLERE